ncbi:MAG: adenylate/guanylate cyclase domain-containing protein [Candidatus Rokuibacteriota bacterium]|nr:MAG: adenylate/guanylate cyclase domain-containing protein [Candidatus Rokubacteria bacterium]
MQPPKTQYARNGNVSLAYQVVGDGPMDVAVVPGFISHVDLWWTIPETTAFIRRLANFCRLIIFDKRGTGLSDPVAGPSSLEERMEDLHAVLDAAGSERCALLGISEGGPMSVLCAATYPDRITSLVLYGTFSTGNPARFPPELADRGANALAELTGIIERHWGEGLAVAWFAPELAASPTMRRSWGLFERAAASPGMVAELLRSYGEIDVTDVLPTLRVPTLVLHRTGDTAVAVEVGRTLAERIPGARFVELPGNDHIPWFGDSDALLAEIEEFLTGSRHAPEPDRALATVLFTDIAGSTERAAALGDRRWRELLARHQTLVRDQLAAYGGREVKTMGDGFLATFDGPAKGIRCACAIAERSSAEGVEIRAGVHTGECELVGDDVAGMAVHIGARVAAQAAAGEVLVSSTVKDLVVGSGIEFADRGTHELKGVPGAWQLLAVANHHPAARPAAPVERDDVAPNAVLSQRGDRVMLRLARRAPGAMRLASRATRRRAEREITAEQTAR